MSIKDLFSKMNDYDFDYIIENTSKAVKVNRLAPDIIKFFYKTNSGKGTMSAVIKLLDDEGHYELSDTGNGPYAYANAPRIFMDAIMRYIEKYKGMLEERKPAN